MSAASFDAYTSEINLAEFGSRQMRLLEASFGFTNLYATIMTLEPVALERVLSGRMPSLLQTQVLHVHNIDVGVEHRRVVVVRPGDVELCSEVGRSSCVARRDRDDLRPRRAIDVLGHQPADRAGAYDAPAQRPRG